ncbi:MAG: ImmA/IrrE family metallo-endopeptidase [Eubacteriales bacterium]|nr:ImmA/IrrE family metallo-endopeptidase [Eubacteriales bacterium]
MILLTYEEIDELGESLIRRYLGAEADRYFCVDIEGFVNDFLGSPILYRTIAEEDSDKIGFVSDGITPLLVFENKKRVPKVFPRGTIVIEKCLRRERESGKRRFTIAHEGGHIVAERTLPMGDHIALRAFHREFDSERRYTPNDFKDLFSFRETQIDRLGAALLMPRFMVHNVLTHYCVADGIPVYGDSILRAEDKLLVHDMANTMGASYQAFFIRLKELGLLKRCDIDEYISHEMGFGWDGGPQ